MNMEMWIAQRQFGIPYRKTTVWDSMKSEKDSTGSMNMNGQ